MKPRLLTVADGLPNNQIRQIIKLPNNQMLVATEGAFCLYNGRRFVPLACNLDSLQRLPSFSGEDYLWQGDSLLWLKDFYSLYLFDTRTRRFRYDYETQEMSASLDHFINKRTDSHISRRTRRLLQYIPLLDSFPLSSRFEVEEFSDYCRDRQGGQWFGLRNNGVLYLPPQFTHIRTSDMGGQDIPRHLTVLDGDLMLVAGAHGIYEYDCRLNSFSPPLIQGRFNTFESHRDGLGRVWVSTNDGLFCYDRGSIVRFDSTNVQGFKRSSIRFALPIDERRLLVCNYRNSLGYFYPDERRMELLNTMIPELNGYRVMIDAAMLSNRNQVAVCTQNGFFVLDVKDNKLSQLPAIQQASHYCHKYNCILLDRTGRLWVGTQDGLLLINGGKWLRITRADGLSNQCIQSLAEDQDGHIWVGTSYGINRIRVGRADEELFIRTITTDDGLPAVEMLERGICAMPNGKLYLASTAGLVMLPTAHFSAALTPPDLVLVGLDIAGHEALMDTLPLRLSYRHNYIEMQVSTLDYAHPNNTRYRYRVVQTDDGWHISNGSDDGCLATVRLGALPPGRYTVEIQASVGDGLWGVPLRKTFIICPPLWLAWWAKLLYLLIAIALFFGLGWDYLRRKREKMQRENERRIDRLFELRVQAQRQFVQAVEVNPERLTGGHDEQLFIERVREAIAEHLANTDYTVDMLARDVGTSRANLYKKMQAMLGVTPNDFMRNVRLKHAAWLLAKRDLPVWQVSLMVGFQTPRYFSHCFRKMFGLTPTEYREGRGIDTAQADGPT